MGQGRLSHRTGAFCADSNVQEWGPLLPNVLWFLIFLEAPPPDWTRECAVADRARALNLEVLGRGLAAIRGLDKSKTLGRVEPLHSTFSHHVVSAGSKTITNCRSPHTGHARPAHDTRNEASLIA